MYIKSIFISLDDTEYTSLCSDCACDCARDCDCSDIGSGSGGSSCDKECACGCNCFCGSCSFCGSGSWRDCFCGSGSCCIGFGSSCSSIVEVLVLFDNSFISFSNLSTFVYKCSTSL